MKNLLKRYLNSCDAKAIDLSEKSGISLATISRYLSGMRVPEIDGENIVKLSEAVFNLLADSGKAEGLSKEQILQELKDSVYNNRPELAWELKIDNLNRIILTMGISKAKFAEEMFYSPSAMTRILSGDTKPRNIHNFVIRVAQIFCQKYSEEGNFNELKKFIEEETGLVPSDFDSAHIIIEQWLLGSIDDTDAQRSDSSDSFLRKLDEFDYETYMSSVDTEAVDRIPVTKFKIPVTKNFNGSAGMEKGILDFLKATVTSASHDPIFMYSDHPIENLTENPETIDKWKKALGAAILQGKRIKILHNVDRPYKEMLLGIESWLPLYMTGNIQSYYSDHSSDHLFNHILMVSGAAVFSGFAAGGIDGQYVFSKNTARIAEGKKNADNLLSEGNVLVEAYNQEREAEYLSYLKANAQEQGNRIAYSDSLPLFTMSDELLERMLINSKIEIDKVDQIRNQINDERNGIEKILKHSKITEIVRANDFPISMSKESSLLRMNGDINLHYAPGEYEEHLELTKKFAEKNNNYIFIVSEDAKYINIRIIVHSDTHAIISRNTGHTLHLMVKHPRLVNSIENELYTMM